MVRIRDEQAAVRMEGNGVGARHIGRGFILPRHELKLAGSSDHRLHRPGQHVEFANPAVERIGNVQRPVLSNGESAGAGQRGFRARGTIAVIA